MKQSQTITFAALPNVTVAQTPVTAGATASSGLPVTFTTTTPSVCAAGGTNGSTITLLTNGTCTVNADQSGNDTYNAAPTVTQSFTVFAVCPCNLFGQATPPIPDSGDAGANVELGVKFTSDVSGFVTGVRFYKAAANTGTHTGSLWSATGTRLATATFTGETASGWQTVTFSTRVAVTAGTTYIASYHLTAGHYAATHQGFASSFDNAPLHAPASGSSGGNGVYLYGASAYPNQSYLASNYYVDPVFATS
ncbi:MAG TPA: DUF4082 domain-containing protein [Acidimicrobiia bacterium]|nr:DUF4082 domain-containing protein [Acidimicrobiia bacterium]